MIVSSYSAKSVFYTDIFMSLCHFELPTNKTLNHPPTIFTLKSLTFVSVTIRNTK